MHAVGTYGTFQVVPYRFEFCQRAISGFYRLSEDLVALKSPDKYKQFHWSAVTLTNQKRAIMKHETPFFKKQNKILPISVRHKPHEHARNKVDK